MKRVLECKVSLMEKEKGFSVDDEGKGNYIIRSSGTFRPEEFMELNPQIKASLNNEDAYLDYVSQSAMLIVEELKTKTSETPVDSVGIWVTFDDGKKVESSMDLSTMDMIKEYHQDVDPYFEFAKMTLQPFYESEVSE
jgi:hypothetical protein